MRFVRAVLCSLRGSIDINDHLGKMDLPSTALRSLEYKPQTLLMVYQQVVASPDTWMRLGSMQMTLYPQAL